MLFSACMQETLKSVNLRKDQQMQDALCNFFLVLFSVFCFFISYGFGFLLCILTLCYGPRPLLIHLGERQWEKIKAWDTSFPSSLSHCWDAGEFPLNSGKSYLWWEEEWNRQLGHGHHSRGPKEKLFHLEMGCRCGTWVPHRASSQLEKWDGAVDPGMGADPPAKRSLLRWPLSSRSGVLTGIWVCLSNRS